jgi:hypothetical protein
MLFHRRCFLDQAARLGTLPFFGWLLGGCSKSSPSTGGGEGAWVRFEPPQLLSSTLTALPDGTWERRFSGAASPQNLEFFDVEADGWRKIHDLFPRSNDPFGIDTNASLGEGGYGLAIVDRASSGMLPQAADGKRPLNMIPFGVCIDGVLLDPSGPWYDGRPADPQNPFDRACSGWEYDPIFGSVASLVGVPVDVRGHVQPGPGGMRGSRGLFHYHGVPRVMLANLRASLSAEARRDLLGLGYSADSFPIIDAIVAAEATTTGKRLHLFSGYVLRSGERTAVPHTNPSLVPPGTYDGTFVQDWVHDPEVKRALVDAALEQEGEYAGLMAADVSAGRAEYRILDDRNGVALSELELARGFGGYAYVLTPDWPEIPRWIALEPSASFRGVIPFDSPGGQAGPPARRALYEACSTDLGDVHQWDGREPY